MPRRSAFKNFLLRIVTCGAVVDASEERQIRIGPPTDFRREDISFMSMGMTEEQQHFIREKAQIDAMSMIAGEPPSPLMGSFPTTPTHAQQQHSTMARVREHTRKISNSLRGYRPVYKDAGNDSTMNMLPLASHPATGFARGDVRDVFTDGGKKVSLDNRSRDSVTLGSGSDIEKESYTMGKF